jgi:hypothetical protein
MTIYRANRVNKKRRRQKEDGGKRRAKTETAMGASSRHASRQDVSKRLNAQIIRVSDELHLVARRHHRA